MTKRRLKGIISVLERYGTEAEKHLVQSAEQHFNQEGRLTKEQKLILESLLKGKIRRMRYAMLSMRANQNSMKQLQEHGGGYLPTSQQVNPREKGGLIFET